MHTQHMGGNFGSTEQAAASSVTGQVLMEHGSQGIWISLPDSLVQNPDAFIVKLVETFAFHNEVSSPHAWSFHFLEANDSSEEKPPYI